MHVWFLVYQSHAFPLPSLNVSCFQFVLESSVWNVNSGLYNYQEWMHVPWDNSPWAIFVASLCRIFDSFSSNAKYLLFTCKLKMSLLELSHQCVNIMLIGTVMVFGHSVRILWEFCFLRGTFCQAKLKMEDWICSSFILSVRKHSLSAHFVSVLFIKEQDKIAALESCGRCQGQVLTIQEPLEGSGMGM